MKPVNLVVEDILSEAVLRRILTDLKVPVATCYGLQGNNYIRQRIRAFNAAAQYAPYIILTDLDNNPCPPQLVSNWMQGITPSVDFIFRVAVKEVESWILADRVNFAGYLGVSLVRIPLSTETLVNPKEFIVELATHARKREIREAIAPQAGSFGKRGKDYNGALIRFVQRSWDYSAASQRSKSLSGILRITSQFVGSQIT